MWLVLAMLDNRALESGKKKETNQFQVTPRSALPTEFLPQQNFVLYAIT